jgi:hypothetical protein
VKAISAAAGGHQAAVARPNLFQGSGKNCAFSKYSEKLLVCGPVIKDSFRVQELKIRKCKVC